MADDKKHRLSSKDRAAKATTNFYGWEVRGRGYGVYQRPVALEPPFEAFSHQVTCARPVDDAVKQSAVGSIFKRIRGLSTSPASRPTRCREEPKEGAAGATYRSTDANATDATRTRAARDHVGGTVAHAAAAHDGVGHNAPDICAMDDNIVEIGLILPPERKVTPDNAEQFIVNTASGNAPVGFEMLGTADQVEIQIACRRVDSELIQQQFAAFFPNTIRERRERRLADMLDPSKPTVIVDFGLKNEFMFPFKVAKSFDPDPLTGVVGSFECLAKGEKGLLQVCYQSTRNPWAESIMRAVLLSDGTAFLSDMRQSVDLAREKIQSPLLAVRLRAVGQSDSEEGAWKIVRSLGGALKVLANGHNELVPLNNESYDLREHFRDVIRLTTHRPGMILSSREAATILHPPSSSVKSTKLWPNFQKMKKAPEIALYQLFKIGENNFFGKRYIATLSPSQLLKHLFISGVTGSGKTTTLIYIIKQIIEEGYGLMFADPHGDAADQLLCHVPASRYQDVIYLDLADSGHPIGINLFKANTELEKGILKADLTAILRRFATSWGDQMSGVAENAFGACIENEKVYTILHIPRFLTDLSFRRSVLETVTDPQIKHYWEKVYPLLIGKSLAPILTRLGSLLRSRAIRNMLAQKDGLDFDQILEEGKIFIVKAPLGLIGSNDSFTLCSILLTKLQQHIWARQAKSIEQRRLFYVAIDEIGHLITPSIASMLSSTRKFGVGTLLSGADLMGTLDQDREISNAILSHPGTRIYFRQGERDARRLGETLSYFDSHDLQAFPVGTAVMSVEGRSNDFNIRAFQAPSIEPDQIEIKRRMFLEMTRARYGKPREQVEAQIESDKVWHVESAPMTSPKTERQAKSAKSKTGSAKEEEKITTAAGISRVDPSALDNPEGDRAATEGKGGLLHRRLQSFVKSLAEDHGFLAVLEEPTADGSGSVDVGLRRDTLRVAVEISVTTPAKHEFMNICKCLKEGYELVILCSSNTDTLAKVKELMDQELQSADRAKVTLLHPEELVSFFQKQLEKTEDAEKRIRGFKVKIAYQNDIEEEETGNKAVVADARNNSEKDEGKS
jgi:hypothetical protein